jgi:hypothetical protein
MIRPLHHFYHWFPLHFGGIITLFHCSIPVQGSQDNITSEKTLKRGIDLRWVDENNRVWHSAHGRPQNGESRNWYRKLTKPLQTEGPGRNYQCVSWILLWLGRGGQQKKQTSLGHLNTKVLGLSTRQFCRDNFVLQGTWMRMQVGNTYTETMLLPGLEHTRCIWRTSNNFGTQSSLPQDLETKHRQMMLQYLSPFQGATTIACLREYPCILLSQTCRHKVYTFSSRLSLRFCLRLYLTATSSMTAMTLQWKKRETHMSVTHRIKEEEKEEGRRRRKDFSQPALRWLVLEEARAWIILSRDTHPRLFFFLQMVSDDSSTSHFKHESPWSRLGFRRDTPPRFFF